MKKNILNIALVAIVAMACLSACTRDYSLISPVSTTGGSAYLRIIDAAPNFRSIFNMPDSFSVFVNGSKVTGYTPGGTYMMTYGSSFPAITTLNGYVTVPAGSQAIKFSVSGVVNADSLPITSFKKTFAANQYYTLMITDSILSARDSSQIFVQDTYTEPTTGYYNLRFIHAVLNDTVGKNVDIWSTRNNRYIFSNVKPGAISSFAQYPFNALLTDTFFVRRTGNSAIALDTLLNTSIFSNQRTYTLYYKGDGNSNRSTNTKRRHLATYIHQ